MNQNDLYKTVYLDEHCPLCGASVKQLEKDTSSGRDMRYFKCLACEWDGFVDIGKALWKTISEANEQQPEGTDQ